MLKLKGKKIITIFRSKNVLSWTYGNYLVLVFLDGREFIPTEWYGWYQCDDNHVNITYLVNLTKSDINFGIEGTMYIAKESFSVDGTFAWFQKVLALQHQEYVPGLLYGNNLTNIEIDMNLISSIFMRGAVVFSTDSGVKTCTSELHRIAGLCLNLFTAIHDNTF